MCVCVCVCMCVCECVCVCVCVCVLFLFSFFLFCFCFVLSQRGVGHLNGKGNNKIQKQKGFKRTMFMMTKKQRANFGSSPHFLAAKQRLNNS